MDIWRDMERLSGRRIVPACAVVKHELSAEDIFQMGGVFVQDIQPPPPPSESPLPPLPLLLLPQRHEHEPQHEPQPEPDMVDTVMQDGHTGLDGDDDSTFKLDIPTPPTDSPMLEQQDIAAAAATTTAAAAAITAATPTAATDISPNTGTTPNTANPTGVPDGLLEEFQVGHEDDGTTEDTIMADFMNVDEEASKPASPQQGHGSSNATPAATTPATAAAAATAAAGAPAAATRRCPWPLR